MMHLKTIGSTAALVLGALTVVGAAPSSHAADRQTRDRVRQANRALADGDFQAALDGYLEAEAAEPESTELNYNRGLAHYKLGEFNEARRMFNEALATRVSSLEASAKFNLGNCAYSEALAKIDTGPEAIELLREAIGFYRHSLELNPPDDDARVNIEMAQLLIKDLLDKQEQEQEQEQQQQEEQQQSDDQQQDQQDQDQQDQEQQEGEDQPKENEQQNSDGQEEEQPPEQQPEEGEQDDQQQPSEEQKQQQEVEMTPEQAERLLQAVRDKERQRRDEQARRMRARRRAVLRDW